MQHIEVNRHSEDFLQVENWEFSFLDGSTGQLKLIRYALLKKENKRKKKFNIVHLYERLGGRNSNLTKDLVPFPQDVQDEAMKIFIDNVKIEK